MCGPGIIWKCRKRFSWEHPFCLTTETKRDGFFKENPIIVWITKMVRGIENAPCHVSCLLAVCVSGKLGWVLLLPGQAGSTSVPCLPTLLQELLPHALCAHPAGSAPGHSCTPRASFTCEKCLATGGPGPAQVPPAAVVWETTSHFCPHLIMAKKPYYN